MARKDYIEKITQNLEHLTKDELKDVSVLTTAQYGVRLKVAEKEYIEKEIANLTSQLQQQALPVVPECVAEWIEILKSKGLKPLKNPETYGETGFTEEKLQNIVFWISEHQEDYMRAWLDGYTVEKTKLFFLKDELTGQFLAKDNRLKDEERYFYWTGADPLTHSIGMAWKLTFTQQEIDRMQNSLEQIEVAE